MCVHRCRQNYACTPGCVHHHPQNSARTSPLEDNSNRNQNDYSYYLLYLFIKVVHLSYLLCLFPFFLTCWKCALFHIGICIFANKSVNSDNCFSYNMSGAHLPTSLDNIIRNFRFSSTKIVFLL